MNYLSEHRTKQGRKYQISKAGLQKGMVVSCRYTNKDGQSDNKMIVILNPGYKGKIHALSLSRFSSKKFNKLAEMVGIRVIPKYETRGLEIPKLAMDQSSNRFYSAYLKDVKSEYNDAYRTYFANKLSTPFVVDYKFDKKDTLLI